MDRFQDWIKRGVAIVSSSAVALQMIVQPIYAQSIVSDGAASGPTVLTTANGTPMVMVNAPNAQGLSHNTYSQFDVGTNGAILNNSNQNYVLTNLGGYVQGNAALSGGTASVILNEVTGANPSDLQGYLEVAGDRADVIVANPYGITCNGCGFINTDHAVLTTGSPSFSSGALSGFSVDGGAIAIGALGVDATGVSQFDLIARQFTFEGAVQGQAVRVIAGRNDVLYATGDVTVKASDGSAGPALAIDSTVLGGMYANSITIKSTEAGAGVRAPQTMSAGAGGMHITADGRLVFGRASSTGSVSASADDIQVESFVKTDNALTIDAAGQLVLDTGAVAVAGAGAVLTAQDMTLGANAAVMGGAFLQIATAGLLDAGAGSNLLSYGDVTVTAGQFAAGMGALAYAGLTDGAGNAAVADLHFDITGDATLSGATMLATGGAQFDASQITIDATPLIEPSAFTGLTGLTLNGTGLSVGDGVALHSGAGLSVNLSGAMSLGTGAELVATDALSVSAGDVTLSDAVLQAGGNLDLTARGTAVLNGDLLTSGTLTASAEALSQTGGTMTGLLGVDLTATTGAMSLSGTVQSDAGIGLTAAGDLTQTATSLLLSTGNNLSLTSGGAAELSGSLKAAGNITLQGKTATLAGDVLAGLIFDAQTTGGALSQSGSIEAGAIKLAASANLSNSGTVIGIADLQAGGNFSNSGTVEGNALSVTAAGFANTGTGVMRANDTLVFTLTGSFDNAGDLEAGTGIQVTAADELTNSGSIESTGAVVLNGSDLSNTATGKIEADSITVDLSGALVSAGTIGAVQGVLLTAGSVTNSGSIIAQAASQIETATLRNSGTISVKGGGLWLKGLAQFDNASGTILSDTGISIATSQALTIGATGWGSVSTDGWMTLAGLNGEALPSLTVGAGAELVAGGDLTIIAGAVTNAGTLASVNGNLVISSTTGISNTGLAYAGGSWLLLRANGTITNNGGTLLALNNLGICGNSTDDCLAVFGDDRTAALTNKNGGQIEAITGDVLIAADVIENGLASDVSVTETVTASNVTDTYTQSCNLWILGCVWGTDFHIETTTTTTDVAAAYSGSHGAPQIVSGGDMLLSGGSITNAYGLISVRGDLSIAAGSVDNLDASSGSMQTVVVRHYKNEFSATNGQEFTTTSIEDPIDTFTRTGRLFGTIEAGGSITGSITGYLLNGAVVDNQTTFGADSAPQPSLSAPTFTLLSIAAAGVSEAAQPGGAGGLSFNADAITTPTLASLGLSDIAGLSNDQLFAVNPNPVSGYLIETKPDFIDLSSFLGSDYFINSLGFDPEVTQIRLGDSLVETYLIRQQLYNLTGGNILDPTLSEKAQVKAMYDNAINAYESLGLRPGISLSPDQIAQLTGDVIWPEERLVNGVKVLVPHVYLASATLDRFSSGAGAEIRGTRIALNTGGILNQGGSIRADEDLILFASGDINNLFGQIAAGNTVSLTADGTFNSLSGMITGRDVGIRAGTINIATALTDIGTGGDRIDIAGRQGLVRASHNLSLSAENALSITGVRLAAGNDLSVAAGGDITLGALHLDRQQSATMAGSSFDMSQRQILASSLSAENGNLSITSARFGENGQLTGGGNIFLEATALSAGDDISIAAAAGDVMLGAGLETRATSSFSQSSGFLGSSSRTSQTFDANYQSTTLDAGGDVAVYGAGNVISQGAQIAAGGDVALQAGYGNLVFDSMTDLHVAYEHHDTSILGGFMDFTGTKETVRATAHDGAVTAGGDIALIAGGDLAIEGGSFTAGGAFSTDVGGETWLSASVDTEFTSSVAHNNNALLVTDTTDVGVSQDANFTRINAKGGVSFDPDSAITLGLVGDQAALGTMARDLIGISDPEDQGQRLALLDYYTPDPTAPPSPESATTPPTDPLTAALSGISDARNAKAAATSPAPEAPKGLFGQLFPQEDKADPYDYSQSLIDVGLPGADTDAGFAYLDDLVQRDTLSADDMQLVQHAFHDQQQELGVVSKLVLNYVVGTITGGMGLGVIGEAMASSVMTGVVNGAVSGHLDLGQIAFSAITAGVTAGLTEGFNLGNELGLSSDGLLREGGKLSLNSIANGFGDAVITSGINSIAYGSDFGTGVLQSFGNSVVSLATADIQTAIGGQFKDADGNDINGGEGSFGHVFSHSMLGCVSEALQGGSCAAGAAGGAIAAGLSGYWNANGTTLSDKEQQQVASLLGGLGASLFSEGDYSNASLAGGIAQSAMANNRQLHRSEVEWIKENANAFRRKLCASEGVCDLTVEAAMGILTAATLKRVSDSAVGRVAYLDSAQAFIDANASTGFVADGQHLFTRLEADGFGSEYRDTLLNADDLLRDPVLYAYAEGVTISGAGTSVFASFMSEGLADYADGTSAASASSFLKALKNDPTAATALITGYANMDNGFRDAEGMATTIGLARIRSDLNMNDGLATSVIWAPVANALVEGYFDRLSDGQVADLKAFSGSSANRRGGKTEGAEEARPNPGTRPGATDAEAGDPAGLYRPGDVAQGGGDAFDPVAFAEGQQGAAPYTGIDSYEAGVLQPGDTVYQLGDKTLGSGRSTGNFFDVNGESVLTAPDGLGAMDDVQVQVNPNYGPYEGYTTFEVTKPIPYATGTVEANPQFGQGGATQGVIDIERFGNCLTPTCYTMFPNGSGQ